MPEPMMPRVFSKMLKVRWINVHLRTAIYQAMPRRKADNGARPGNRFLAIRANVKAVFQAKISTYQARIVFC